MCVILHRTSLRLHALQLSYTGPESLTHGHGHHGIAWMILADPTTSVPLYHAGQHKDASISIDCMTMSACLGW